MSRVYLDYSATTPVDPLVVEAMVPYFHHHFGNASSIHAYGRETKSALEESRERIAGILGARMDELIFTSGGTESDNFAIKGLAAAGAKKGKNHVLVSSIEHHAVLHPAEALRKKGFEVDLIPVDRYGVVDLDYVKGAVSSKTCVVSILHANNEIGTIEPIREVSQIAKLHGAVLHTDAVQSVGKIPLRVADLGVDVLSMTAHKLYGPKGIGAIFIRRGVEIESFMEGGGQEQKRRAGTENVPLAVGFAKAVEICQKRMVEDANKINGLKRKLKERLSSEFDGIQFNGHPSECLPNILSISFQAGVKEIDGEALIMGMDLEGVAVTSGSACSSGSLEPSHVLLAIGHDEKTARASIRFSLGRNTTEEEIHFAVEALHRVVTRMEGAFSSPL